jgi:TfoX/Sxy family transcriptional regulator of competence genes
MAYDTTLAERVRKTLARQKDIAEKKMFGGIAFLVNGNLCCGVHKADLIVRIDPDDTAAALKEPGARPFDLTGRPMKGWIIVATGAVQDAAGLRKWVKRGLKYATTLPPK